MSEPSTTLIHHPYKPPAGFDSIPPGVYKASTIVFPSVEALRNRDWKHKTGYTYGLHGTPTTFTLEERIATLEGGKHCTLVPSGLAAVVLVGMALLKAGDELLIPDNAYGPNKAFAQGELAAWGITHRFYDAMNPADLAAKLGPKTRLVWIEAPGSLPLEFPDMAALVAPVKAHPGAPPRGRVPAPATTGGAHLALHALALRVARPPPGLTSSPPRTPPSGPSHVVRGALARSQVGSHVSWSLGS